MKKSLFLLVLVFAITAYLLYRHYVPDDAFIHFEYAKGILGGHGYTFAGNKTYGASSPMWPPLIALTAILLRNIEMSARFLSFVFAVAAVLMLYNTARLRFDPFSSFVAAFLLATNSYFIRWSLTGMETAASCFFMVFLAFILYRENDGSMKRWPYLLLGLAPLVRPEFYAFLLILFAYVLFRQRRHFDFTKAILAIIPVTVWLAFAFAYFGTIVPTTFIVKAGAPFFSTRMHTLVNDIELFLSGDLTEIAFILMFAISTVVFRRRNSRSRTFSNQLHAEHVHGDSLAFVLFIAAFYFFYGLKNVILVSRYTLMLSPLLILLTIYILRQAEQTFAGLKRKENIALISLMLVSLFYNVTFTAIIEKPRMDRYYEGFQTEYVKIAGILKNLDAKHGQVALTDVGIIGYYSGYRIDDLVGLVDKDRLNYRTRLAYVEARKPDFMVLHGELNPKKLPATFKEIYGATVPARGTSDSRKWHIKVYRVIWR